MRKSPWLREHSDALFAGLAGFSVTAVLMLIGVVDLWTYAGS